MVQFKHNAMRQFKFSVSSSFAETRVTTYKQKRAQKKTEGNKETKDFLRFSDQKQNTNLTLRCVPLYL